VERTAQPAILCPAERQVGAAVGAVAVQQAQPPRIITEQHEVLTQQAHPADRAGTVQLVHQRRGLAVLAHEGTQRRARPRLGNQRIAFRSGHRDTPSCSINERAFDSSMLERN